jgi:serine/threonine protein kinase
VYKCTQKSDGSIWALKRLVKAEIDSGKMVVVLCARAIALTVCAPAVRLSREISIMKQLQHPSILRMKEAFDSPEFIDLIMQVRCRA